MISGTRKLYGGRGTKRQTLTARQPTTVIAMDYEVKSLARFGLARDALDLQGFLNGWVTGNGYEVVSVFATEDDWLVVVKK
jgi:hypothetical protein